MRTLDEWLDAYGEDHQNPTNQIIHKFCVPLIMLSLLGLLWTIPTPSMLSSIPFFNWAVVFCASCLVFYTILSPLFALAMFFMAAAMLYVVSMIALTGHTIAICSGIFVVAWIGQFYGHKVEGKKPSFLTDLQFLLIGPLWVIKDLIPRGQKKPAT